MNSQRYPYSDQVSIVKECQFGMLSPQTIKQISVAHVYKPITNHQSYLHTAKDPRLGAIKRGDICPTCKQTYMDCPGHFGHIVLSKPLLNVTYYSKLIKVLRMVCNRCSSLLVDKNNPEIVDKLLKMSANKRFMYLSHLKHLLRSCPNCKALQPSYKQDKTVLIGIRVVYPESAPVESQSINPELILNIFKKIPDTDINLMGLDPVRARPEYMIWTILPVPPMSMRPSVTSGTGEEADDDLTYKLNDIVKVNAILSNRLTNTVRQKEIHDYWNLLQYHVDTYINNNSSRYPQATHRSGRPLKTIESRLVGKSGRIRGNLMGKRVNNAARSVITADPNISLDQLGVPLEIAQRLLVPEYVTTYNRDKLRQLVLNGLDKYPGARSYLSRNEIYPRDLSTMPLAQRQSLALHPGDIVYRQLMDGDVVLFNRQPSLHRMSMMAHQVVVLPGRTFRLNVNATSPYNADFDGDEMNMHVAQSQEARTELFMLASVPTQIVSPQASKPVIGLVQDSLLGSYTLSEYSQGLDYHQMMTLYPWFICKKKELPAPQKGQWTPQQLISLFLPPISYRKSSVLVKDGQMVKGQLGKSVLGTASSSLFHVTWNDLGPIAARDLINHISWTALQWLTYTGFSVGYQDCIPSQELTIIVRNNIASCLHKVRQMIREVNMGVSAQGISPQLMKQSFPGMMIQELNECRRKNKEATDRLLDPSNRIYQMVKAGSKGNPSNIGQIMAQLGQQELEGSWIPDYYHRRPLVHFSKNTLDPEGRGFVVNSFYTGLNPAEYWFHAQVGRVGVISKTIKTATTGYIQRQLVKMLEDVIVDDDLSVRNSRGAIIQTVYGGDGFDPKFHEKQTIPFIAYNQETLVEKYQWTAQDMKSLAQILTDSHWNNYQRHLDRHQQLTEWEFQQLLDSYNYLRQEVYPKEFPETVDCPVNLDRLLDHTKSMYVSEGNLEPVYVIGKISDMLDELRVKPRLSDSDQYRVQGIFRALILSKLSSKQLILHHKLSREAFNYLLDQIKLKFWRSVINPGEAVGVITAQSIGEPTTQMTLDTFHHTGIGSKANVARGVPRIEELIYVTSEINTPSMTIYLRQDLFKNMTQEQVQRATDKFRASIEYTVLDDLITEVVSYYDPQHQQPLARPLDPDEELPDFAWGMRLEFSRSALSEKLIFMEKIGAHLYQFMTTYTAEDQFYLQVSDSNDRNLWAVILLNPTHDPARYMEYLEHHIKQYVIQGIEGIKRGVLASEKIPLVLPDGTVISPYDLRYDEVIETYQGPTREFRIDTEGSNLVQILSHPYVDTYRTITNNIVEIYHVYGVEVARSALIKEIDDVISFSGSQISQRHLDLLVDLMVHKGVLISINRYGLTKTGSEVLHRVSFEDTIQELVEAGFHSEVDHMNGISDNIMLGQFIPAGTGKTQVALDVAKLAQVNLVKAVNNDSADAIIPTMSGDNACQGDLFKFRYILDIAAT